MGSYLLDTNVVLRLMDRHAPEHPVCRRAVERLRIQGESLCLAPQVLVEFWAVATRPPPPQANGFGWTPDYTFKQVLNLRRFFTMYPESPELFNHWLKLVRQHNVCGRRVHDARIAAFMKLHGIDCILTLNPSDFRNLGVKILDPNDI